MPLLRDDSGSVDRSELCHDDRNIADAKTAEEWLSRCQKQLSPEEPAKADSDNEEDNQVNIDGDELDLEGNVLGSPPGMVDSSTDQEAVIKQAKTERRRRRKTRRERRRDADSSCSEDSTEVIEKTLEQWVAKRHETTAHSRLSGVMGHSQNPRSPSAREDLRPSNIEEAAMQLQEALRLFESLSRDKDKNSNALDTCVDADHPARHGGAIGGTNRAPRDGISIMEVVKKPGISAIQRPDEWIQIEVTVDSGACVTVMPVGICMGISILQNAQTRAEVEYEVANGQTIPNLGERKCEVMTAGSSIPKRITFQVADVHKPLLSITGCADMGYDCYLGKEGGSLRDRTTGEIIPLERKDSLYVVKMWVRQDPTVNVSQPFAGPG